MTQLFTLTFRLSTRDTSTPVYYKRDGGRFESTNTVKLNANTEYDVNVTVKPKLDVKRLTINGEIFPVKPVHSDEEDPSYTCQFTTPAVPSKKGKRDTLPVLVDFKNGSYMKLQLQCKLYREGETNHVQWGDRLSSVTLDCRMQEGINYVTILNEKYW